MYHRRTILDFIENTSFGMSIEKSLFVSQTRWLCGDPRMYENLKKNIANFEGLELIHVSIRFSFCVDLENKQFQNKLPIAEQKMWQKSNTFLQNIFAVA